jgi:hypothetical protein
MLPSGTRGRVVGAVSRRTALERRVEQRIAGNDGPFAERGAERRLDALPARAADVREVARVDRAASRADELDVVGELRAVRGEAVVRALDPKVPRTRRFVRGREHGGERRVGDEDVRERARRGRVCARELDRRRHAHAAAHAAEHVEARRRLPGGAHRRVEPAIGVRAVDVRIVAAAVLGHDARVVVAAGQQDRPLAAEQHRVACIEAVVARRRRDVGVEVERPRSDGLPVVDERRRLLRLPEVVAPPSNEPPMAH